MLKTHPLLLRLSSFHSFVAVYKNVCFINSSPCVHQQACPPVTQPFAWNWFEQREQTCSQVKKIGWSSVFQPEFSIYTVDIKYIFLLASNISSPSALWATSLSCYCTHALPRPSLSLPVVVRTLETAQIRQQQLASDLCLGKKSVRIGWEQKRGRAEVIVQRGRR